MRTGHAGEGIDGRVARRAGLSSVGLVLIVVGVSAFAVWSSQATASLTGVAATASQLSDDYGAAAKAVAAEESLERKYRLEPGAAVQVSYGAAAEQLRTALARVRSDGQPSDRTLVDRVLTEHTAYLAATALMFQAVDRGDTATTLRIDRDQVDPAYASIESAVHDVADTSHQHSLDALRRLQDLEIFTGRLTPVVFLAGLLLAAKLAAIGRGYRALLSAERLQAIHDSLHDALTGLPNRTSLSQRLGQAVRAGQRGGTTTALLVIDLDRFKDVNDTFGHEYGDLLLVQVGERLVSGSRDIDTVARLGGDEFAVVLPDIAGTAHATIVAERLLKALRLSFPVEDVRLDIEASIGIAVTGGPGDTATRMLQQADVAMYAAKSHKSGTFAYDSILDTNSPAKLSLLGELRRALDRRELVLYYQPKINVTTGEIVGVEALLRWNHPVRGLVSPDEFIPMAEHTGLIGPLTTYVLDEALGQARIWVEAGRGLPVAVNISARNLLDDRLSTTIAELLAAHRVPARLLHVEITESALLIEPDRARCLLERLDRLGVVVSIDDFGAGYTSLGQLKILPISELKIDRSFITPIGGSRSDAVIVQSVIELGHNLGMTIVAEGVENVETVGVLAGLGCDVIQGYYLSRPMPTDTFDLWFLAHNPTRWTNAHHRAAHPGEGQLHFPR